MTRVRRNPPRVDLDARGFVATYRLDACRCGCGAKPEPPRRTFATDDCIHRHKMRTDPGYVRWKVWERDRGVCADCGRDASRPTLAARYRTLVLPPGRKATPALGDWQADHIRPVAEGGGLCDLDGYRTLCSDCHKRATADLARRLAARRRAP